MALMQTVAELTSKLRVLEAANQAIRKDREQETKRTKEREEAVREKEVIEAKRREADRQATAVSALGSMRSRRVSTSSEFEHGSPYVPRSIVPKHPGECSPSEYIIWEQRFEAFVAHQGLRHTISADASEVAVISCSDNAYVFGQFGEDLVTDHRLVWWYISEATAGTAFGDRLYECHCISDALKIMREWSLPLFPVERHLLMAEMEKVQFILEES